MLLFILLLTFKSQYFQADMKNKYCIIKTTKYQTIQISRSYEVRKEILTRLPVYGITMVFQPSGIDNTGEIVREVWWSGPPLENYKVIGFLRYTGPDPLENRKATKPAFMVRPPVAYQQKAI